MSSSLHCIWIGFLRNDLFKSTVYPNVNRFSRRGWGFFWSTGDTNLRCAHNLLKAQLKEKDTIISYASKFRLYDVIQQVFFRQEKEITSHSS